MAWESFRIGSGTLQMIQELCKPVWVVQKQPANHCLKPCSPAVGGSFSRARTTPGAVATATDEIQFIRLKQFVLLQPGEESGLGIGSHVGDNSTMQGIGPSGP